MGTPRSKLLFEVQPPVRQNRFARYAKAPTEKKERDSLYDNNQEREYAMHLEAQRQAGIIEHWWLKPFSIRLGYTPGKDVYYRPDFMVQMLDGTLAIHETKGYMEEDARLKLAWVAQRYPFPIFCIKKAKARDGYSWETIPFQAA